MSRICGAIIYSPIRLRGVVISYKKHRGNINYAAVGLSHLHVKKSVKIADK
jgi:hypothetical protein